MIALENTVLLLRSFVLTDNLFELLLGDIAGGGGGGVDCLMIGFFGLELKFAKTYSCFDLISNNKY